MALDEPEEEDIVIQVNGIQVAIEVTIKKHTDGVTLDFNENKQRLVFSRNTTEYC